MAQRLYPDDRAAEPDQRTFREFVTEARDLYRASIAPEREPNSELKFLKFVLAGRRGMHLEDQTDVSLNTAQGLPPFRRVTVTRDYDSLIGITRGLPYRVPMAIWPVPPFRDVLKQNAHILASVWVDGVSVLPT